MDARASSSRMTQWGCWLVGLGAGSRERDDRWRVAVAAAGEQRLSQESERLFFCIRRLVVVDDGTATATTAEERSDSSRAASVSRCHRTARPIFPPACLRLVAPLFAARSARRRSACPRLADPLTMLMSARGASTSPGSVIWMHDSSSGPLSLSDTNAPIRTLTSDTHVETHTDTPTHNACE